MNASVLKVKLAMAIMGINSVHLLKTFIAAGNLGVPQVATKVAATSPPITAEGVMWQTIIHWVFILSALGTAYTDRVMPCGKVLKPTKH